MVTRIVSTTNTNRQNFTAPTDMQRIARALRRADLIRTYTHGTIKRSAMAMINHYMRQAHYAFAPVRHREYHSDTQHELHMAM